MPTRIPVNEPGPDATAKRSTSKGRKPCAPSNDRISCGNRSACVREGSPRRSASIRSFSTSATLPARVVVSSASTLMLEFNYQLPDDPIIQLPDVHYHHMS